MKSQHISCGCQTNHVGRLTEQCELHVEKQNQAFDGAVSLAIELFSETSKIAQRFVKENRKYIRRQLATLYGKEHTKFTDSFRHGYTRGLQDAVFPECACEVDQDENVDTLRPCALHEEWLRSQIAKFEEENKCNQS